MATGASVLAPYSSIMNSSHDGLHGMGGSWTVKYEIDFGALPTTDLDHTAATVSIGGKTWTVNNGVAYLDDLDLVANTGLVFDMGAASSSWNPGTGTYPYLSIPITSLYDDYSPYKVNFFEVIVSAIGDENNEMAGLSYLNNESVAVARGIAAGTVAVVSALYNTSAVTQTATAVSAGVNCVSLMKWAATAIASYGATDGVQFPPVRSICGNQPMCRSLAPNGSDQYSSGNLLTLWAQTGNTNNNFTPAFRRLRCWQLEDSGGPYGV